MNNFNYDQKMTYKPKCLTKTHIEFLQIYEEQFRVSFLEVSKKNKKLAEWLWSMRAISYDRFWEIALGALKKNVMWDDTKGRDLSDGHEVKTAKISVSYSKYQDKKYPYFTASVNNVKNKTGDIKVIMYDPWEKRNRYYLIPNEIALKYKQIRFSISRKKESKAWTAKYEVDFETLVNT